MLLEKGKIYKKVHSLQTSFERNYILFAPKEDVEFDFDKGNILCSFLINFLGELCLDKSTGLSKGFTDISKPTLKDMAEISHVLRGNGLTYNRITREIVHYGETRKGQSI
jgi:hypothetical protein